MRRVVVAYSVEATVEITVPDDASEYEICSLARTEIYRGLKASGGVSDIASINIIDDTAA